MAQTVSFADVVNVCSLFSHFWQSFPCHLEWLCTSTKQVWNASEKCLHSSQRMKVGSKTPPHSISIGASGKKNESVHRRLIPADAKCHADSHVFCYHFNYKQYLSAERSSDAIIKLRIGQRCILVDIRVRQRVVGLYKTFDIRHSTWPTRKSKSSIFNFRLYSICFECYDHLSGTTMQTRKIELPWKMATE